MAQKRSRLNPREAMAGKRIGTATVLRAAQVPPQRRACVVGGDAEPDTDGEIPTIVLEKDAEGNITRIAVHCACGRTAELICAYD